LNMCIRALDYCPPVDLKFGDYLRAIITADADLVADDARDYRLAFIDAFRKRGIYPEGVRMLSVDSLRFLQLNIGYYLDETNHIHDSGGGLLRFDAVTLSTETVELLGIINTFLREYADKIKYHNDRQKIYELTKEYIKGNYKENGKTLMGLHQRINVKFSNSEDFAKITGLAFLMQYGTVGVSRSTRYEGPSFQVQNLRLVSRVGPDGNQVNQVVFSIVQRSGVVYENGRFARTYNVREPVPAGGFEFRGACTLIFDLDKLTLKYAISKPLLDLSALENGNIPFLNMQRLDAQYKFQNDLQDTGQNEYCLYFGEGNNSMTEPFAFLHQH
jgi:hypothetical protein